MVGTYTHIIKHVITIIIIIIVFDYHREDHYYHIKMRVGKSLLAFAQFLITQSGVQI